MQTIFYPLASLIFYTLTAFLPQLGVITAVFAPLLMLLYLKTSARSIISDLAAVALITALAGYLPVVAGFYIVSVLFPAVFIFRYLNSGRRDPWVPSAIAPLVSFIIVFIVIYAVPSYRNELIGYAEKMLTTFFKTVKDTNAPMAQEPYFLEVMKNSKEAAKYIVLVFPAVNYIFTSFSAHIALNLYAKLNRIELPSYRLPDYLVWVLIAGFALSVLAPVYPKMAGLNIILIMMSLYAYQGFDIMVFWMIRLRIIPVIRAIIFVFIFSEPPIIIFVAFLGLFSVWFSMYPKDDKEQKPSN